MKFNPTLPLALALSVGAGGAVMAQTATTSTPAAPPSTSYSQPSAAYGQPQANPAQAQTGQTQASTQQKPAATEQTPAATAQTQQPRPTAAAPSTASAMAPGGNEQVRMAQQRLKAAGLYNGPQDGIMDPDTRAAIARYQQQQGLNPTESLDPSTLASLEQAGTTGYGPTTPPPAATPPSSASGTTASPSAGAMGGNTGKAGSR